MGKRSDLGAALADILGNDHVYFQPPASYKMTYPAIRYALNNINQTYADDTNYTNRRQYVVTYITRDPDSDVVDKLADSLCSRFNRYYSADNLHHYVYEIYY